MIKIGELSEITGVSVQTIRFYEREKLLSPVEVDRWTNYRYYDDSSIYRLCEISQLKDLGFSLKEIKNLDEKIIKQKIRDSKINIKKLIKNIHKLSTIKKVEGEIVMNTFVNDPQVVGKWEKIGTCKTKEDFKNKKFSDNSIFNFNELYFLKGGENYWIFSWTKGFLFVKKIKMPYEIIDGNLFIGVVDFQSNKIDDYAVFKKVDNKEYLASEIEIYDNTDLPFINDKKVIGFWKTYDFIDEIGDFDPENIHWQEEQYLKKYTFEPDGVAFGTFGKNEEIRKYRWTKNYLLNDKTKMASEYIIKEINNKKYMIIEWKSGDYTFGGKISGYYVLEQNK